MYVHKSLNKTYGPFFLIGYIVTFITFLLLLVYKICRLVTQKEHTCDVKTYVRKIASSISCSVFKESRPVIMGDALQRAKSAASKVLIAVVWLVWEGKKIRSLRVFSQIVDLFAANPVFLKNGSEYLHSHCNVTADERNLEPFKQKKTDFSSHALTHTGTVSAVCDAANAANRRRSALQIIS